MTTVASQDDLRPQDFAAIRELLYRVSGIDLNEGKEGLVQTRLARRLRELGLAGYREYLDHVLADGTGSELSVMVDLLTTNKTDFFREEAHFSFLRSVVLPARPGPGMPLRIWSAGCSSGEEPYSIAILLREALPQAEADAARILGTDISERVLAVAREGVYTAAQLAGVEPALRRRYFSREGADAFRAAGPLRSMVRFARLNLMADWPMRGPFDVIFCRNVMIYFDRPTQERLVQRYWELLAPGGYLFTGHSESLNPLSHRFRYVQPAVYRR